MSDPTYVAMVPLPSLSGCPFCGMTNVVKEVSPSITCKDCGKDYWPVGVVAVDDGREWFPVSAKS